MMEGRSSSSNINVHPDQGFKIVHDLDSLLHAPPHDLSLEEALQGCSTDVKKFIQKLPEELQNFYVRLKSWQQVASEHGPQGRQLFLKCLTDLWASKRINIVGPFPEGAGGVEVAQVKSILLLVLATVINFAAQFFLSVSVASVLYCSCAWLQQMAPAIELFAQRCWRQDMLRGSLVAIRTAALQAAIQDKAAAERKAAAAREADAYRYYSSTPGPHDTPDQYCFEAARTGRSECSTITPDYDASGYSTGTSADGRSVPRSSSSYGPEYSGCHSQSDSGTGGSRRHNVDLSTSSNVPHRLCWVAGHRWGRNGCFLLEVWVTVTAEQQLMYRFPSPGPAITTTVEVEVDANNTAPQEFHKLPQLDDMVGYLATLPPVCTAADVFLASWNAQALACTAAMLTFVAPQPKRVALKYTWNMLDLAPAREMREFLEATALSAFGPVEQGTVDTAAINKLAVDLLNQRHLRNMSELWQLAEASMQVVMPVASAPQPGGTASTSSATADVPQLFICPDLEPMDKGSCPDIAAAVMGALLHSMGGSSVAGVEAAWRSSTTTSEAAEAELVARRLDFPPSSPAAAPTAATTAPLQAAESDAVEQLPDRSETWDAGVKSQDVMQGAMTAAGPEPAAPAAAAASSSSSSAAAPHARQQQPGHMLKSVPEAAATNSSNKSAPTGDESDVTQVADISLSRHRTGTADL